jgi:5-methylcytosine-specific restriction endonuclease McrA
MSEDELKKEYVYKGKSDRQIAAENDLADTAVRYWRNEYGIEGRKAYKIPELHLPQYLEWAYVEKERSMREIAENIGACQQSVSKALIRNGIETRPASVGLEGEKNYAWNGGTVREYGHYWMEQREKAKERDGFECRACGMSNQKHNEKYGRDLDVHHVVPIREFDDPKDAHSLGNLVTSCRECHGKYEGVPVFPL